MPAHGAKLSTKIPALYFKVDCTKRPRGTWIAYIAYDMVPKNLQILAPVPVGWKCSAKYTIKGNTASTISRSKYE